MMRGIMPRMMPYLEANMKLINVSMIGFLGAEYSVEPITTKEKQGSLDTETINQRVYQMLYNDVPWLLVGTFRIGARLKYLSAPRWVVARMGTSNISWYSSLAAPARV